MRSSSARHYREAGPMEKAVEWLRRMPLGQARRPLRRFYRATMSLCTLGRGLACDLPSGDRVFVSPAYRYITWNPIECEAFRAAIAPGAVALDIGANVGAYALLLGRWVRPGGRVFAFEPSPDAYDGLRRHVALNGLTDLVTVVRSAVAAERGILSFVVEPTAGEGRLAAPGEDARRAVQVPVTSVDEFCARERIAPGFIKVDVEGAELDVLRGARETIARTRGRLALFVELHPSLWPSRGVSRADIEGELRELGLRVESLLPGADPWTVEGVTARLVAG